MFINKTFEYSKLLNIPLKKTYYKECIADTIRKKLNEAKQSISDLQLMLERHCLPSFNMRKRKMSEINHKKAEINLLISKIESLFLVIEKEDLPESMRSSIKHHFATKLKRNLLFYRNIQQSFLKKISSLQTFEDLDSESVQGSVQEMVTIKKSSDSQNIKKTIFHLTTLLLEMKMIIQAQSYKIDRIDFLLNQTYVHIDKTNQELVEIPKYTSKLKNSIIYALSMFVFLLIILSILKAYKIRKKRE
ncbi:hypothetical protein CWI39_0308p0030 [Hamiltosporidium magnivora]|uniref:t-SNARE coiled-coil homology domain-containing protein n=1 Tax=Hamiltosporidium magnivora TaxID=148818 RepID=A0A4V2JWD2_9MICR|nr:hypothetical protein CWI39_0308p0030 [Hamiltosporidium magnivora]